MADLFAEKYLVIRHVQTKEVDEIQIEILIKYGFG